MRCYLICLLIVTKLAAQDTLSLDEVVIKAAISPLEQTPLALSIRPLDNTTNPLSTLGIPGLQINNNENAAQDPRIAIRGFGARAAFGIRGINVYLDGIPQTTPDGQTQIDHLPTHLLDRVAVIRGLSGTRYGNASGGVINFQTIDDIGSLANFSAQTGSFGMWDLHAAVQHKNKNNTLLASVSTTTKNGYRNHSGYTNHYGYVKYKRQWTERLETTWRLLFMDSPYAYDAGALTLEEVRQNRAQARQRNVDFNAQEAVTQWQASLNACYRLDTGTLSAKMHWSPRDFMGWLPFENYGAVDLNRNFYGTNLEYQSSVGSGKWLVGIDFQQQDDHRQRFQNLAGSRGAQGMNQIESFGALSGYGLIVLTWGKLNTEIGLRFDRQALRLEDRFLDDGDQQAERQYGVWTPTVGVVWTLGQLGVLFVNLGTAYETPALSELSANPYGAGFNPDVEPSHTLGVDLGYRCRSQRFQWEAVAFHSRTRNELVRYELEALPGQNFYRNLGTSTRYGLELEGVLSLGEFHQFRGSMTQAAYRFDREGQSFRIPGVAERTAHLGWQFDNKRWQVGLQTFYQGALYADDLHNALVPDYTLVDLNLGYQLSLLGTHAKLGLTVQNLTNASYFDNIRINAFGKRYYEPAAGRQFFVRLACVF